MSIRASNAYVHSPPWNHHPQFKQRRLLTNKSGSSELRPVNRARDQQESNPFSTLTHDALVCIVDFLLRDKNGTITIPGLVCASNLAKTCQLLRFDCQDLIKTPFDVGCIRPDYNFHLDVVRDDNVTEQRCLILAIELDGAKVVPLFDGNGNKSPNNLYIARVTTMTGNDYNDPNGPKAPVQIYFGHAIAHKSHDFGMAPFLMLVPIPIDEFVRIFSGHDTSSLYEDNCIDIFNTARKKIHVPIWASERPRDAEGSRNYSQFNLALAVSASRCSDFDSDEASDYCVAIETGNHMIRNFHQQTCFIKMKDFKWLCDFAGRFIDYPVTESDSAKYLRRFCGCMGMIEPPTYDSCDPVVLGTRYHARKADRELHRQVTLAENVGSEESSDESGGESGDESDNESGDESGDESGEEESENESDDSERLANAPAPAFAPAPAPAPESSTAVVRRRVVQLLDSSESEDSDADEPGNSLVPTLPTTLAVQFVVAQPVMAGPSGVPLLRLFNTPHEAFNFVNMRTREERRKETINFQVGDRLYQFTDGGSSRRWHVVNKDGTRCSQKTSLQQFFSFP